MTEKEGRESPTGGGRLECFCIKRALRSEEVLGSAMALVLRSSVWPSLCSGSDGPSAVRRQINWEPLAPLISDAASAGEESLCCREGPGRRCDATVRVSGLLSRQLRGCSRDLEHILSTLSTL